MQAGKAWPGKQTGRCAKGGVARQVGRQARRGEARLCQAGRQAWRWEGTKHDKLADTDCVFMIPIPNPAPSCSRCLTDIRDR
jgi:hypothetical protein